MTPQLRRFFSTLRCWHCWVTGRFSARGHGGEQQGYSLSQIILKTAKQLQEWCYCSRWKSVVGMATGYRRGRNELQVPDVIFTLALMLNSPWSLRFTKQTRVVKVKAVSAILKPLSTSVFMLWLLFIQNKAQAFQCSGRFTGARVESLLFQHLFLVENQMKQTGTSKGETQWARSDPKPTTNRTTRSWTPATCDQWDVCGENQHFQIL